MPTGERIVTHRQQSFEWMPDPLPAGASTWPRIAGHLVSQGGHRYVCSKPDHFAPHIVIAGRGRLVTRHGTWSLRPGDMFTVWPGIECEYADDPAHPWSYRWIHLAGPGAAAFVAACGFSVEQPVRRPRKPNVVADRMRRILDAFRRRPHGDAGQVLAWLYELLPSCVRAAPTTRRSPANRYQAIVDRGVCALDRLLPRTVNITQLAESLGVSRITLFRAFRATFGRTPIEYLAAQRVQIACRLLCNPGIGLKEVARASGFGNQKYFYRRFKQATGRTPTEYRLAMQKGLPRSFPRSVE